jgi:hypothetical protein
MFDHYVFTDDPAAHVPESARGVLGEQSPALRARMRATLKGILQRL